MHLYITTRGIKHQVDRLISDLQAQYFPFKHDGVNKLVQLAVRPIQLWELVFPRDSLQQVMRTLWMNEIHHKDEFKLPLGMLRKMLKSKKIPELDLSVPPRAINNQDIAIYGIGVKDDKDDEHGEYL